jgi:hypothetical protein
MGPLEPKPGLNPAVALDYIDYCPPVFILRVLLDAL